MAAHFLRAFSRVQESPHCVVRRWQPAPTVVRTICTGSTAAVTRHAAIQSQVNDRTRLQVVAPWAELAGFDGAGSGSTSVVRSASAPIPLTPIYVAG